MALCEKKIALKIDNPGVSGHELVTEVTKDTGLMTDFQESPDGSGVVTFECGAFVENGKIVAGGPCTIDRLRELGREFPPGKCLKQAHQSSAQPATP